MLPNVDFEEYSYKIQPGNTLYILSDGVYEILQPDGTIWGFDAFMDFLCDYKTSNVGNLDIVLHHVEKLNANKVLDDDFSLLQINLN
jgi:sigma-B regulation protein RsbU (phosphoserine phosphatase)